MIEHNPSVDGEEAQGDGVHQHDEPLVPVHLARVNAA